jgi:hypothetical protein
MSIELRQKSTTSITYSDYTSHEVFTMIRFASDETIKNIASQITNMQFAYLKKALMGDRKLSVLTDAREEHLNKIKTFVSLG